MDVSATVVVTAEAELPNPSVYVSVSVCTSVVVVSCSLGSADELGPPVVSGTAACEVLGPVASGIGLTTTVETEAGPVPRAALEVLAAVGPALPLGPGDGTPSEAVTGQIVVYAATVAVTTVVWVASAAGQELIVGPQWVIVWSSVVYTVLVTRGTALEFMPRACRYWWRGLAAAAPVAARAARRAAGREPSIVLVARWFSGSLLRRCGLQESVC